jgi:hypothetical protein
MNLYTTTYYFLGTDDNVDYYLTEPKKNKTTITNYCELNVLEHDKIDDENDDRLIASMYHFGDDSIMSLEDFLSLKNDNLSKEDKIKIFNVCKEINLLISSNKVDVNIIKNVFDKWKIVEEIFTKSNNKNSA